MYMTWAFFKVCIYEVLSHCVQPKLIHRSGTQPETRAAERGEKGRSLNHWTKGSDTTPGTDDISDSVSHKFSHVSMTYHKNLYTIRYFHLSRLIQITLRLCLVSRGFTPSQAFNTLILILQRLASFKPMPLTLCGIWKLNRYNKHVQVSSLFFLNFYYQEKPQSEGPYSPSPQSSKYLASASRLWWSKSFGLFFWGNLCIWLLCNNAISSLTSKLVANTTFCILTSTVSKSILNKKENWWKGIRLFKILKLLKILPFCFM